MRKIIVMFMSACAVAFNTAASEAADSLEKNLDEVVVEAATVIRKVDKSIYTVGDAVKDRSSGALDLLKNLQIPNLTVNEVMDKVTSSLGTVQIRLNGREIDVDKLKTVDLANVRKIEWIDNPGLRYGTDVGAVVNLIVVNPTAGGALRLSSQQALTTEFNNSYASLTLNSGASQWQAGGWLSLRGKLDTYRDYDDRYRLPDGTELLRTQKPLDGYFDSANSNPYLSYNYVKPDTTNFYVGLYYYTSWRNKMLYDGVLDTDISRAGGTTRLTETYTYPWTHIPSVNVYWEQKMHNDQTLVFSAAYSYNSQRTIRQYKETDLDTGNSPVDIDNAIDNSTNGYYVEGNYIKNWEKGGQLTAGLRYNGSDVHSVYLDYNNRVVDQRLDKLYFFGEYMIPVKKFTFTVGVGGTWNKSRLVGSGATSTVDFTPRLNVNWRAGDKSRWSLTYNNFVVAPSASELSPVTQSIDGVQIERGNPDLKSYLKHQFYLRYNYSDNNGFNLSSFVFDKYVSHPIFSYYSWEGDKILRGFSNEGSHNLMGADVSVSWEVVKEWMSVQLEVSYLHYLSRGKGFRHTLDSWEQSFGIDVYHWNWNLGFQLSNPAETLWGEQITRQERFNLVTLGYKWRNWKFDAYVFMPFGRYSQEERTVSRLVSQRTVLRTNKIKGMPLIRITYSLNWGRQKPSAQRKLSGSAEAGSGAQAAGR